MLSPKPQSNTDDTTMNNRAVSGAQPDNTPARGDGPTGGGGGAPTGPAGGDLAGTYPNPTLAAAGPGAITKGSSTRSAVVTLDAKGRVVGLTDVLISAGAFPYFNIVDYGADPTGATDSLAGINAAIAALNAAGAGLLYIPAGLYNFSGVTTTITVPCEICGQGEEVSRLQQGDGSSNVINIDTEFSCWIHGVSFRGGGSTGHCLNITAAGSFNIYTKIEDCSFVAADVGVNLESAASTTITNCTFGCNYGVILNNLINPDQGAGTIAHCTITSTICGILLQAADGLSIMGNHIIGGDYAFRMEVPDNTSLVDLWVIGNHIENQGVAGLSFKGPATSGGYGNIVISGNEFAYGGPGPDTQIDFSESAFGAWASTIAITGNVFSDYGNFGIDLYRASAVSITGNVFATGGAGTAINIDASCSNGFVTTTNVYAGSGTSLVNSGGFV